MASSRSRFPWLTLLLLALVLTLAYNLTDDAERTGDPERDWAAETPPVTSCPENLAKLGEFYHEWRADNPQEQPRPGPAFLIELRQEHRIPPGGEELLICPSDPFARHPTTQQQRMRYDAVDEDDPTSYAGMVSYAFRDFATYPIDEDADPNPLLGACRCGQGGDSPHHKGGLYILHASGRVAFRPWEALGVDPRQDAVIVGPGSKNEQLAKLIVPR